MTQFIQNFMKYRPLLSELVSRDIKIKYRRSVLGVLWTLLNPLCMMIVLSIVFSNLFKFGMENFPVYLLSGQLIFNFYSDATTSSMSAIINNASLIKKIYIPKYLFVVSRVISSIINLCASFCAMIFVMVAWIPMLLLMVFSLGAGLVLSAITVKFRDIMHLYSVFVTALMYLTPVIYPMNLLPEKVKKIVMCNPLTNILNMFRNVMMYNTLPSVTSSIIGIAEAAVMLAIGLRVFYKMQDEFILNI